LALAVFLLFLLAGANLLRVSLADGWWLITFPLACLTLFLGGYGTLRALSGLFRPATKQRSFELACLELKCEHTRGPLNEAWISCYLEATLARKAMPKTVRARLTLAHVHHPNDAEFLDGADVRFENLKGRNVIARFTLEVPRHVLVRGDVYALVTLVSGSDSAFYRVNIDRIAQVPPLTVAYQPTKREQFEAFAAGDAAELISRAYNGQHASGGFLMHGGGPYLQNFSPEEERAVFTIRLSELIDHLESINWFAQHIVDEITLALNGYCILRESNTFKVMWFEASETPNAWFTQLHESSRQREAFEAFMLHSDAHTLSLRGASELLQSRSTGDGKTHPQAH
jgi:hypothetical protein